MSDHLCRNEGLLKLIIQPKGLKIGPEMSSHGKQKRPTMFFYYLPLVRGEWRGRRAAVQHPVSLRIIPIILLSPCTSWCFQLYTLSSVINTVPQQAGRPHSFSLKSRWLSFHPPARLSASFFCLFQFHRQREAEGHHHLRGERRLSSCRDPTVGLSSSALF